MSEQTQTIFVAIASVFVLVGVFRLIYINHPNPHNVSLTRWMFTGGSIELVIGLFKGTANIFRLYFDSNAKSSLCIYAGILLMVLVL